jgi:hypothetical protein
MSLKNPVTPLGIDTGTVRLLAQRLSHYATPGPHRTQPVRFQIAGISVRFMKKNTVSILMCSCRDWFYSARELHSELQQQVKYICVLLHSWEVA